MPRKALDQEMQTLHAQIMQAGSLVVETLTKALASFETGNQAELHLLITSPCIFQQNHVYLYQTKLIQIALE